MDLYYFLMTEMLEFLLIAAILAACSFVMTIVYENQKRDAKKEDKPERDNSPAYKGKATSEEIEKHYRIINKHKSEDE